MIVITTPTGNIGSMVLQKLVETGQIVRVVVRDPSKLSDNLKGKIEIVQGSLDDPEVLAKAYQGAEQLLYIVPPGMAYSDVNEYYLSFARPTCEAIRQQGVKRVVYVSGTGLGYEKKAGPVSASYLVEELLEKSGAAVKVLHCGSFMENLLHSVQLIKYTGSYGTPVPANIKFPWVATRDIADAAICLLTDHSWSGNGSVGVLGPEDLSYGEITGIMKEVLGREISYHEIPAEEMKATIMQYGASDAAAQGLIDIYLSMKNEVFNRVERTPKNSSPTSFRIWCEEVFKAAMG